MSENQEKDQLGLWEKLHRLYGENDPETEGEIPSESPGENIPPEEKIEGLAEETAQQEDTPPSAEPETKAESPAEKPVPRGIQQRYGYRSPTRELGRINETCGRCKRSCKQTGQKLNRMLCIGFLPIEE